MLNELLCPYCGKAAKLVGGMDVYPHRPDLAEKKLYQCVPCDAYVGCHPGTTNPLGRLANAELRKAKMAAHAAFDPTWKDGKKKRGSAYAWLSDRLRVDKKDCHIGMFDVETCRRVVEVCQGAQQQPFTGRAMSAFEVAQMQEDMTHLRVLWRAFRSDCSTAQYMEYKDAITEILER